MTPVELPKTLSGIDGLDQITLGGLPAGRTTIVSGGPGCGKTIMGLQFVCHGAENGEPGIYITFEETRKDLQQNALTLGWDIEGLVKRGKLIVLDNPLFAQVSETRQIDLEGLRAAISAAAKKIKASRIVLDALDILLSFTDDAQAERREVILLQRLFQSLGMTAILTSKIYTESLFPSNGQLDFLVDCVIHMEQRVTDQINTRRLRIQKYRGSGFGRNEYPYAIGGNGIHIIPVSTLGLRHQPLGEFISSGQTDLDTVLGGGYRRASSVLVAGVTGTGKTSLAATFAQRACSRGERLLYISFEESREAMINNMRSPGIDLESPWKAGLFRYLSGLPESMGAEEHLLRAHTAIVEFTPQHIVLDAISACRRMGSDRAAFDYLIRLLNLTKEMGITCLLLNQTVAPVSIQELSGVEISSIIDTVLSLHMVEETGEINRTLVCLKSRGAKHSNQYREFRITDSGIQLLPVYIGAGRVLTGTARKIQEDKDAAGALKLDQQIDTLTKELEKLQAAKQTLVNGQTARFTMRGGHVT